MHAVCETDECSGVHDTYAVFGAHMLWFVLAVPDDEDELDMGALLSGGGK